MGSLQQWKKDAKTIQESRCGSKVCGKMTDDNGAGKLAEELFREWWLNNSEAGLTHSGIGFHAFTSGFNAGRKA